MTAYRETRNGIFLRLYHLFRKVQQSNRFITRDLGTDLGIAESSLLLNIDSRKAGAKDLAKLLKLDTSVVSRNLSTLVSKGYIETSRSTLDARSKILTITQKGRHFLKRYDELSNKTIGDRLKALRGHEDAFLVEMFRHFADSAGVEKGVLREIDLPLRVEFRRVTTALGLLKKYFMNGSLNVAQWQVLAELEAEVAEHSHIDLAEKLSISASSISTIMAILEKKKCVIRTGGTPSLTPTGIRILRQTEEEYCARIAKAFSDVPDDKLEHFETVLSKYLGLSDIVAHQGSSDLVLLTKEEDLKRARAFLVENLLLIRKHLDLPSRIMAEDSLCLALQSGSVIVAVAEIREEDGHAALINFAASPSNLDLKQQKDFLEKVCEFGSSRTGAARVDVSANAVAGSLLEAPAR